MTDTVAEVQRSIEQQIQKAIANGTDPDMARFTAEIFNETRLKAAITAERSADSSSGGTQGGKAPPANPGVSAGDQVNESRTARDQGRTQSPPINPQPQVESTATSPDTTDSRTSSAATSKTVNAATIASGGSANGQVAKPQTDISDLAQSTNSTKRDDEKVEVETASASAFNDRKVLIPAEFVKPVETRDNPMEGFASAAYTTSLYLLSPENYRRLVVQGERNIFRDELLISTGGAPYNAPTPGSGNTRNRFFDVDFYIDDLEMKSFITGQATQGAHNVAEIRFKITEPNGITLLDRLKAACTAANPTATNPNYAAQPYLLVVKFFGYDENGDIISLANGERYIEKFIPFVFTSIKFRVANQLVEYACEARPLSTNVGYSTKYGEIPFNFELTGGTVAEILTGEVERVQNTDNEPVNANTPSQETAAINATSVTRGLVKALNQAERSSALEKGMKANVYKIEFVPGYNIESATVVPEGFKDKSTRPMSQPDSQSKNPDRGQIDNSKRKYTVSAGTQIVQVLQNIVQRSSYIRDQQNVITDTVTREQTETNKDQPFTKWYKVRSYIKPLEYDEKRNDYVYEIKYVIGPYKLAKTESPYFPDNEIPAPHKRYDYWFTGENKNVLDFEQDFNYLYYVSVTTPYQVNRQVSGRETVAQAPKVNSQENSQGHQTQVNEPASNLASTLFSPADQGRIDIKIIGDPDYIQQNEILFNSEQDIKVNSLQAYLPDGSINYDSRDVVMALRFRTPTQYDETGTGVMENPEFSSSSLNNANQKRENEFLYRVNIVTSTFSKGQFTQNLECTLILDKTVTPTVDSVVAEQYGVESTIGGSAGDFEGVSFGGSINLGNIGVGSGRFTGEGFKGASVAQPSTQTQDRTFAVEPPPRIEAEQTTGPPGPPEDVKITEPTSDGQGIRVEFVPNDQFPSASSKSLPQTVKDDTE